MKAFGIVLIGVGIALLFFTVLSFFSDSNRFVSPVPETKGVKVIIVNPTK